MVTSIDDNVPYLPIPIANFVTDAILHDGVIWIGFDKTSSLYEIPVLWRCDNYPDAGDEHVKLAGIEFHKVNVSAAVPVEMSSDIISISVFEVIDDDLWAVGYRRLNSSGTYCSVFYKLVDGTFVETGNGPYTSTNAFSINKLTKAPKGGIYATSIKDGFLYINGSAQDISAGGCIARRGAVLYKAYQEVIDTDQDYLRLQYAQFNYYSFDGITWHQTRHGAILRTNKFYENAILSFRGAMWGLRENNPSPGIYTTTLLKMYGNDSWQEIVTMSGAARLVLAMGDAVILQDYSRQQAFAIGPEKIEHCSFPWQVKRAHGNNLQACLLCEDNSSVTVVIGSIGLSVFNISLEWGTEAQGRPAITSAAVEWGEGDGVERPQVDSVAIEYRSSDEGSGDSPVIEDVQVDWAADWYDEDLQPTIEAVSIEWKATGDIGETPAVSRVMLEWGTGMVTPALTDQILWFTNDDTTRTCYKVRICSNAGDATEALLRCIIRTDLETLAVDAWQSYEEFACNELYTLERPGHEVRIGIIAPDETSPIDLNIQLIREDD